MTYEEAINWIKSHRCITENTLASNSARMSVDALEKQIPKKPKKTDRADILSCFDCGFLFGIDTYKFLRCCPKCGQAIDWSDAE